MKKTPPQRAPRANPPGKNGFKYCPRFGVVVLCDDEQHQARVFESLQQQGLKLRVVAV